MKEAPTNLTSNKLIARTMSASVQLQNQNSSSEKPGSLELEWHSKMRSQVAEWMTTFDAIAAENEALRQENAKLNASKQSIVQDLKTITAGLTSTQATKVAFKCLYCVKHYKARASLDCHVSQAHRGWVFFQDQRTPVQIIQQDGKYHCLCGRFSSTSCGPLRAHTKKCQGSQGSQLSQKATEVVKVKESHRLQETVKNDKPVQHSLSQAIVYKAYQRPLPLQWANIEPNAQPNISGYVPFRFLLGNTSKELSNSINLSWAMEWCNQRGLQKQIFTNYNRTPRWAIPGNLHKEFVDAAIYEVENVKTSIKQINGETLKRNVADVVKTDKTNAKRKKQSTVDTVIAVGPMNASQTIKNLEGTSLMPEYEEKLCIPVNNILNTMIPSYMTVVNEACKDVILKGVEGYLKRVMEGDIEEYIAFDLEQKQSLLIPSELIDHFTQWLKPLLTDVIPNIQVRPWQGLKQC